jgi:hypothetical protein
LSYMPKSFSIKVIGFKFIPVSITEIYITKDNQITHLTYLRKLM